MMENNEYWALKLYARKLFLEWWMCRDKKKRKIIYGEYLGVLRNASKIAPSVDIVWLGHK